MIQKSEWIFSISFLLLLFALSAISTFHSHRKKIDLSNCIAKIVDVKITGEVVNPGVFPTTVGTRLGDVIKKSRPKRFADLESLKLDNPIVKETEIAILPLLEISVFVEGAVLHRKELKLPVGSRICDLKHKIEFSNNADLQFLKSRRQLANGETVTIPEQKEEEIDKKTNLAYDLEPALNSSFQRTIPHSRMPPETSKSRVKRGRRVNPENERKH
ncbi:MAG TPA: hypothetical protein VLE95_04235 [Chlamydiales bacterium]|nr:hypothetical protein [Chlamydiales bacterium]